MRRRRWRSGVSYERFVSLSNGDIIDWEQRSSGSILGKYSGRRSIARRWRRGREGKRKEEKGEKEGKKEVTERKGD